jgi:ribonuclease BN (tRNA processing enzyme)
VLPDVEAITSSNGDGILDDASGISIAGSQTSISIPKLDVTLDAGKNVPRFLERNLLVSHYDPDHSEGIGLAMCSAMQGGKKLDIVLPSMKNNPSMKKAIDTFADQDKNKLIKVHEASCGPNIFQINKASNIRCGGKIKMRDGTLIEPFKTPHSPGSLGYVIWKKHGGKWKQELTFTGDTNLSSMNLNARQLMRSEVLVAEATFSGAFLSFMEPLLNMFTSHSSMNGIRKITIKESKIKDIGLIHLPPAAICSDIENDIKFNIRREDIKIHYLPSCTEKFGDDQSRPVTFKALQ